MQIDDLQKPDEMKHIFSRSVSLYTSSQPHASILLPPADLWCLLTLCLCPELPPPTLSNDRFAIFMPSSATFPWSEQTATFVLSWSQRVKVLPWNKNGTSNFLIFNRLKIKKLKFYEAEMIRRPSFPEAAEEWVLSAICLSVPAMSTWAEQRLTLLGRLERQDRDERASDRKMFFSSLWPPPFIFFFRRRRRRVFCCCCCLTHLFRLCGCCLLLRPGWPINGLFSMARCGCLKLSSHHSLWT